MITETGENLNVLIVARPAEDWKTFATWYSVYKNLPEAKVAIACVKNEKVEFQFFQWAKRLNVPIFYTTQTHTDLHLERAAVVREAVEKGLTGPHTLVFTTKVMAIDVLDEKWLQLLRPSERLFVTDYDVWYLCKYNLKDINDLIDDYGLSGDIKLFPSLWLAQEAKESNKLASVVTYGKGCGRWIDTMHGCPFSNASGLATESMTVNETRVVDLWRKMVPLYSAVL